MAISLDVAAGENRGVKSFWGVRAMGDEPLIDEYLSAFLGFAASHRPALVHRTPKN
jgi:hypothetical protein